MLRSRLIGVGELVRTINAEMPLEPGVGKVVTGCLFRNERNHGLRALHVSVAGEALAAWRGEPVAVLTKLPEADMATWNLEVEAEHVCRVGHAGSLVHNTCPTPKELFEGAGVAAKRVTTPVGELRDVKLKGAHQVIQDAAVRVFPGYNPDAAPGVQLRGPANVPGTPHQLTRPVQRQAGG
jgi:hypothetical protein